jgi:hypothetical protein
MIFKKSIDVLYYCCILLFFGAFLSSVLLNVLRLDVRVPVLGPLFSIVALVSLGLVFVIKPFSSERFFSFLSGPLRWFGGGCCILGACLIGYLGVYLPSLQTDQEVLFGREEFVDVGLDEDLPHGPFIFYADENKDYYLGFDVVDVPKGGIQAKVFLMGRVKEFVIGKPRKGQELFSGQVFWNLPFDFLESGAYVLSFAFSMPEKVSRVCIFEKPKELQKP